MATNKWSGLTDEQDKIWDQWWDQYVPQSGQSETVGGEVLRAMTRIIYRFYNDGDMAGRGYGNETVNSSNRYLVYYNNIPGYDDLMKSTSEADYEERMLRNHRAIFNYLSKLPGLFEMENKFDSCEPSDSDLQASREDEGYYDEDEY